MIFRYFTCNLVDEKARSSVTAGELRGWGNDSLSSDWSGLEHPYPLVVELDEELQTTVVQTSRPTSLVSIWSCRVADAYFVFVRTSSCTGIAAARQKCLSRIGGLIPESQSLSAVACQACVWTKDLSACVAWTQEPRRSPGSTVQDTMANKSISDIQSRFSSPLQTPVADSPGICCTQMQVRIDE